MNYLVNSLLFLHIVGGSAGLITGTLNILGRKGGVRHKTVGRIFYFSMLLAGTSALILSRIHENNFLFMIGIFTLYMVISGKRYLKHRTVPLSGSLPLEWTLCGLMFITGMVLIGSGLYALFRSNLFGLVFLTFGIIGLLMVRQDFLNFTGRSGRAYGLLTHLQRMTGAFIASLTAFLVVNARYFPDQIPGILFWLLPTVVFTPLISKWSRKYAQKVELEDSTQ
ncbi:MAG: hypothetical protein H6606_01325 [Flavobacteriales bacterium]|nr:hypothetical protein [Flavobacteriales bacterium]